MRNSGDGAEESFWIHRTLMVKMIIPKYCIVDPCRDIACILCITVAIEQDEGVDDEKSESHVQQIFMVYCQGDE